MTQANWHSEYKSKLLGKEYMQANCAQCHTEEKFAGTPLVERGRQLFFEKACYGGHRIEGLADGILAPDLTEVGKKYRIDYLWGHTVNPRNYLATSFMPKFDLSDDEIMALVIFLKNRRGINFAETSLDQYRVRMQEAKTTTTATAPNQTATTSAARGEQLIGQRACTACHRLGDRDGHIVPDFSFEGLVRDSNWMTEHFRDPGSRVPDSIMPSFGFPEDDFLSLVAYLKVRTTAPAFQSPEEFCKGTCARCHGEKGDGRGMTYIYLDPEPRDLTKAKFMINKPEERFLKLLKEGVPGTSMPPRGRVFTDDQRRAVLTYVFQTFFKEPRAAVTGHKVPELNPVAMSAESVARGEQTFMLRCTGCHGRKADGKGPNSLDISPQPRNVLNHAFVSSVDDRRLFDSILYGVQGTAMPSWIDYGLSTNDAGDLINFIRSLNQQKEQAPKNEKTAALTSKVN